MMRQGNFFVVLRILVLARRGSISKTTNMIAKLKNILRCYAVGMGIKETANTFHISRNTARKYVRLFISSGKPTEQLLEFTEEQLRDMFGCTEFRRREPSQRQLELDALIPDYVASLSRKGMTVRKLFKEYREGHPDGFQESVFKRAVRQYRFHTTVIGHVEHYAADQMYINFAGDRLTVVDEMTGEVKKAEVFVAILPFSHYTYCEAVWFQRKEDLIKACQNAFHYFEGIVAAIVPDSLKAAVKTSDRTGYKRRVRRLCRTLRMCRIPCAGAPSQGQGACRERGQAPVPIRLP